ncbi:protein kinase, partial [bacterium]|nr:protein kinase [bacterium]
MPSERVPAFAEPPAPAAASDPEMATRISPTAPPAWPRGSSSRLEAVGPGESGEPRTSPELELEVARARKDPARAFGPFVLLEELGRGAMGVVHRAFDERLRRVVALKTILPGAGAPEDAVKRFRREAEAVARLRHPNIVSVHEAGEVSGTHYISMDFIVGSTLDRRLEPKEGREKISLTRAVEVVRDVARAVHHAHEQGVVHRDLKPANVLVDARDNPFVLDFGLASLRGAGARLTRTGVRMGTPAYMSPEQADGLGADERSDVYSLGATLYHVLTGKPPFSGQSELNVVISVLTRPPVPPGSLNRRAAGDLDTISMRCLEKEPARRYESAAALADDLDRHLRGEPIVARPIGLLSRLARRAQRNKLVTALGALALALALGLVVVRETSARTERRRLVDTARLDAASSRDDFSRVLEGGAGPANPDEVLGRGLTALRSGLRLVSLVPEDAAAREGAWRTALSLGEAAEKLEQWSVAASAFEDALALSVDDDAARGALATVATRRRALKDAHRATVEATIAQVLSRSETYDHDDALFTLVRLSEPETVSRLSETLDEATRLLEDAKRGVYLAAEVPDQDEERAGAPRLAGLRAALERSLALEPGNKLEPELASLLESAGKRIVDRHVRAYPSGKAPPVIQRLVADAQGDKLGPARIELAKLACEALGRLGQQETARDALARYLRAEADERRAERAAVALVRLGDAESARLVRASPHFARTWYRLPRIRAAVDRASPPKPIEVPADPKTAEDFLLRAAARSRAHDSEGSIADLTRAIELDGSSHDAFLRRGALRVATGDLAGAVADLTRAIELD